jgi:TolB protein
MKTTLFLLLSVFSLLVSPSSVSAQTGRIAFINTDGQLATANPDGSDVRVLSSGDQRLQFPAWSPDSSKIATIGIDREGSFIHVLSDETAAAAKEIYRSNEQGAIYLYWSPDSKTVSFLANNPDTGLALHLASETEADRLLAGGAPFYWQWTSDAQNLLIHTGFTGEGSRLGFISLTDATLQENLVQENLAPPGFFQAPGVSASGNYIAYAEANEFRGTQVIIQNNPTLTEVEAVKREVKHEGAVALSWSPSEDKLAFTSPAKNAPAVYGQLQLLDAETGLLETLSENLAVCFFWSPDGKYIAYLTPNLNRNDGDVSSLENTFYVSRQAVSQQVVSQQVVSQQALQQVQERSFLLELHVVDITTKEDKRLATFTPTFLFVDQFMPFFDQYALSHHIWSPDSSALVLPITNADSTRQITVFNLDGTVTPIAEGDTPFWSR